MKSERADYWPCSRAFLPDELQEQVCVRGGISPASTSLDVYKLTGEEDMGEISSDSTVGLERVQLLAKLVALPQHYTEDNWDGYGAAPLSNASFSAAIVLVQSLPIGFPSPRIVVDPDGDICFKWAQSRYRRAEITISDRKKYYAIVVNQGVENLVHTSSTIEMITQTVRALGWAGEGL